MTHLLNILAIAGLIHDKTGEGSENTPRCGAKATGAPPLISTSLSILLERILARYAAKDVLTEKKYSKPDIHI